MPRKVGGGGSPQCCSPCSHCPPPPPTGGLCWPWQRVIARGAPLWQGLSLAWPKGPCWFASHLLPPLLGAWSSFSCWLAWRVATNPAQCPSEQPTYPLVHAWGLSHGALCKGIRLVAMFVSGVPMLPFGITVASSSRRQQCEQQRRQHLFSKFGSLLQLHLQQRL